MSIAGKKEKTRNIRRCSLLVSLVLFAPFLHAAAEPRIALVIGNGTYGTRPLSDAPRDAGLIANTLSKLDFEVVVKQNQSQTQMRRLIRDFGNRLQSQNNAVGLFYYSGHGVQVGGRNYMIPIGAMEHIFDAVDVTSQGVGMDEVLARMDIAKNRMNFIVLDACRDDPFEKRFKSGGKGLNEMDTPKGSLIAFAAEPHKVALQGSGRHSVFSEALSREMVKSGIAVEQMFKNVRIAVDKQTNGKQLPTTENRLLGDFYFNPGEQVSKVTPPVREMFRDVPEMVRINAPEPFLIERYEVTFEEYDRFANATGRELPGDKGLGRGRRPVITVSWDDAVAYTEWLSEQTGKQFRLPTEAEWDFANRAGTETTYWWGDEIGHNNANCNNCGSQWDGRSTAPVGSYKPNPFGLYDTAGNVWEWTQDCWDDDCAHRVIRGGSSYSHPETLRSAHRESSPPVNWLGDVGFRLAQDL